MGFDIRIIDVSLMKSLKMSSTVKFDEVDQWREMRKKKRFASFRLFCFVFSPRSHVGRPPPFWLPLEFFCNNFFFSSSVTIPSP